MTSKPIRELLEKWGVDPSFIPTDDEAALGYKTCIKTIFAMTNFVSILLECVNLPPWAS